MLCLAAWACGAGQGRVARATPAVWPRGAPCSMARCDSLCDSMKWDDLRDLIAKVRLAHAPLLTKSRDGPRTCSGPSSIL